MTKNLKPPQTNKTNKQSILKGTRPKELEEKKKKDKKIEFERKEGRDK